jgi:hypothetical protein
MFEQLPESRSSESVLGLVGGLFLGVVAGVLIPVVVFMLVSVGGQGAARFWMAEILDLTILGVIGYLTYQEIPRSMLARGMMIGISLSFLLNAICGLAMLRTR